MEKKREKVLYLRVTGFKDTVYGGSTKNVSYFASTNCGRSADVKTDGTWKLGKLVEEIVRRLK